MLTPGKVIPKWNTEFPGGLAVRDSSLSLLWPRFSPVTGLRSSKYNHINTGHIPLVFLG